MSYEKLKKTLKSQLQWDSNQRHYVHKGILNQNDTCLLTKKVVVGSSWAAVIKISDITLVWNKVFFDIQCRFTQNVNVT